MKADRPVLVRSGASAAGKTAVANAIIEQDGRFTFLRSATTRPKRGDGNDGEYIYLTRKEFLSAIERGEVLEHMEYAGNLYGTLFSEIERAEREGKIPLLVLDINGMKSLYKNERLSACTVFVYAPLSLVEKRLRARFTVGEDEGKIKERIERNREDYLAMTSLAPYIYSFAENSGALEDCTARVLSVFEDFLRGKPKEEGEVLSVANYLEADALVI